MTWLDRYLESRPKAYPTKVEAQVVERKIDNFILDGYPKLGLDNLSTDAALLIRAAVPAS